MATTYAVINNETGLLLKTVQSAEEKKEFEGQDVSYVTKKTFEETEQYKSWDEMIGKVKPVENEEKPARSKAAELTGPYHLLKPLPACADDHPKKPIWVAIEENDGGTCEQAIAACPAENPARRTSGKYSFSSEFRYFLKTGYVTLAEKPHGFDHKAHHAAQQAEVAQQKADKPKKSKAKKETTEAPADTASA